MPEYTYVVRTFPTMVLKSEQAPCDWCDATATVIVTGLTGYRGIDYACDSHLASHYDISELLDTRK